MTDLERAGSRVQRARAQVRTLRETHPAAFRRGEHAERLEVALGELELAESDVLAIQREQRTAVFA